MLLSPCLTPDFLSAVRPLWLSPLPELFSLLSQVPFLFSSLVSPVSVCICAQCVFTVTKAHFQTPTPVVTDTLRVPMAGLAFSHQLSSSRLSYQPAALGVGSADLAYPVAFAAGLNATHPHQVSLKIGRTLGVPVLPPLPCGGRRASSGPVRC